MPRGSWLEGAPWVPAFPSSHRFSVSHLLPPELPEEAVFPWIHSVGFYSLGGEGEGESGPISEFLPSVYHPSLGQGAAPCHLRKQMLHCPGVWRKDDTKMKVLERLSSPRARCFISIAASLPRLMKRLETSRLLRSQCRVRWQLPPRPTCDPRAASPNGQKQTFSTHLAFYTELLKTISHESLEA